MTTTTEEGPMSTETDTTYVLRYEDEGGQDAAWTVRRIEDEDTVGHPVWADETGITQDDEDAARAAAAEGVARYEGVAVEWVEDEHPGSGHSSFHTALV